MDAYKSVIKHHFKHGHCFNNKRTRTYRIWKGMVSRCHHSGNGSYKRYGYRGIVVCERWRKFENFLLDMGECSENLQLDRIDGNGNYEPSNCRWVTAKEQTRNRKNTRFLTYNGQTKTLSEWANTVGITRGCLETRLNQHKWSVEKAITTPKMSVKEASRLGLQVRWKKKP